MLNLCKLLSKQDPIYSVLIRGCSTKLNWIRRHLNKSDDSELSWRENPNEANAVPIKRGDIYYKQRTLRIYPFSKRKGYNIKWFNGGFLPRVKLDKPPPTPNFQPRDTWAHDKAYFGQNDYIDILGDGIKNQELVDKGPAWVRGVPKRWNELQWLIRKNNYMGEAMKNELPESYRLMESRIRHLYYYYNVKLAGREGKYKRSLK